MTTSTELVATGRSGRRADESVREFLDELRREKPHLFDERCIEELVTEIEDYAPRATKRDSFRLSIQAYLSDVSPLRRQPSKAVPRESREERDARLAPEVAAARQIILGNIGPTTIIGPKPLGEWTIGELRALNGLFSFILDIAGPNGNERLVREVMRAKDWRHVRKGYELKGGVIGTR